MCLSYSEYITKEILEKFDSSGTLVAYKIYINNDNHHLASQFMSSRIDGPGIIYARSINGDYVKPELTKQELDRGSIGHGIHVYINLADAHSAMNNLNSHRHKIVPVYCKKENLRAGGNTNFRMSAVFTQVEIKEDDWYIALDKKDPKPLWVAGEKGTLMGYNCEPYTNFRGKEAEILEVTNHNVRFRYGGLSWTCGKTYFCNNYCFKKHEAVA